MAAWGSLPDPVSGDVVSDFTVNTTVVLTRTSNPPLKTGTYYFRGAVYMRYSA
jgi:hypothetical protein